MTTHLKAPRTSAEVEDEYRPSASEVETALSRILESPPFRTSKQCKDLLRYIVEQSLTSADAALRERVIGAEVFGRRPDYDTNEDPVVRTRASDVRKRLAQYYQSLHPETAALLIELQPGSYRCRFRVDRSGGSPPAQDAAFPSPPMLHTEAQPELATMTVLSPASRVSRQGHARFWLLGLLLLAGAVAASLAPFTGRDGWSSPEKLFWAPFGSAKQPLLVYLGANMAYVLSPEYLARYRAAHGIPNNGPEIAVDLPSGSSVRAEDLIRKAGTFVTSSDTAAAVQVTTLLGDWRWPFVLRSGGDLSMSDLRNRPTVLVGAFNNPWTLEMNKELPFRFEEGTRIQERDKPGRAWSVISRNDGDSTDDYALVTRVLVSRTGGPSLTIAGVSEYGTRAAAEFVTNPERMRDLLRSAPRGWEAKNMQVVLHVKVLRNQPVACDVVATRYW